MENDDFWRSEIVQITARTTESGAIDLELTPRSGNYTILFGRLDDAEQKLDKLLRFYREGLGKAGMGSVPDDQREVRRAGRLYGVVRFSRCRSRICLRNMCRAGKRLGNDSMKK